MCIQGFGGETRGDKDHFDDQDVNGRIILKFIFQEMGFGACIRLM
jgi:hypothetical protein